MSILVPSIIQFKDVPNDSSIYPVTLMEASFDASSGDQIYSFIDEYNVSNHHRNTTQSAQGTTRANTNVFTLEEAIATVPNEYHHGGLKLTFNSDISGNVSSYVLNKNVWNDSSANWIGVDRLMGEEISQLGQEVNNLAKQAENRKYIKYSDGQVAGIANDLYIISDYIDVSDISCVIYSIKNNASLGAIIAAYDSAKAYIQNNSVQCVGYTPNKGIWYKGDSTKYIRIAYQPTSIDTGSAFSISPDVAKFYESANSFNVNKFNNVASYGTKSAARSAVPENHRKSGLLVSYKLADGWYTEQYINDDIANWGNDTYWERPYYLDIDSIPSAFSEKLITSGAVYDATHFSIQIQKTDAVLDNNLIIDVETDKWISGSNYLSYYFRVKSGETYRIKSNSTFGAIYAIIQSTNIQSGDAVSYSQGGRVALAVNEEVEINIVNDSYLWIIEHTSVVRWPVYINKVVRAQEFVEYLIEQSVPSPSKVNIVPLLISGSFNESGVYQKTGTYVVDTNFYPVGRNNIKATFTFVPGKTIQARLFFYNDNNENAFIGSNSYVQSPAEFTVPDGAKYFRIAFTTTDYSGFNPDVFTSCSLELSLDSKELIEFNDKYIIVPYYDAELRKTIEDSRSNIMDFGKNGVAFVFITDIHYEVNAKTGFPLIKRATEELNLQGIVCGGDIISGDVESSAKNMVADCISKLKGAGRVYCMFGNHDTNYYQYTSYSAHSPWTKQSAYSLIQKQMEEYGVVFGSEDDELYYYFDNANAKTRFVVLDTGVESAHLSQTQLDWLSATLQAAPNGYHILVLLHIAYKDKSGWFVGMTADDLQKTTAFSEIETVLDNYNSSNSGATIEAVIGGHVHLDVNFATPGGIPVILSDCNSYATYSAISGTSTADNERGTIAEQAFDIISVDYSNRVIKCVRCGRGDDRTFNI